MGVPSKFAQLKQAYPWPQTRPAVKQVDWGLDAGGKRLVLEELLNRPNPIVLEIGVFLGGSAKLWLESSPDVNLIAVDPWPGMPRIGNFARRHGQPEWVCDQLESDEEAIFDTFVTNLWEYRDRIVPVRGCSPEALYEVAEHGIEPDLIYLDGDKSGSELEVIHELFPNAVITGDDWFMGVDHFWRHNDGYKIRKPVLEFCARHQRHLLVDRATWVIRDQPANWRHRLTTIPLYHLKSTRRRVRGVFRQMLGLQSA